MTVIYDRSGLTAPKGAWSISSLLTAVVAAETVRQLLSGNPVAGVLHSEQAIALDPVISALRKDLPDLVVAL